MKYLKRYIINLHIHPSNAAGWSRSVQGQFIDVSLKFRVLLYVFIFFVVPKHKQNCLAVKRFKWQQPLHVFLRFFFFFLLELVGQNGQLEHRIYQCEGYQVMLNLGTCTKSRVSFSEWLLFKIL